VVRGFCALHDVTTRVEPGERHAVIGPNGAGKSTLFNVINGQLKATSGRILMNSKMSRPATRPDVAPGMGRTFQRNNIFLGLSLFQNVALALKAHYSFRERFFSWSKRANNWKKTPIRSSRP